MTAKEQRLSEALGFLNSGLSKLKEVRDVAAKFGDYTGIKKPVPGFILFINYVTSAVNNILEFKIIAELYLPTSVDQMQKKTTELVACAYQVDVADRAPLALPESVAGKRQNNYWIKFILSLDDAIAFFEQMKDIIDEMNSAAPGQHKQKAGRVCNFLDDETLGNVERYKNSKEKKALPPVERQANDKFRKNLFVKELMRLKNSGVPVDKAIKEALNKIKPRPKNKKDTRPKDRIARKHWDLI